ncbi:MAG: hypothetical protein H3C59_02360 [Burkholderiaceae bacterium]|mgnify:CR=1 FL=1|nr:hypothetical protein [Burkholderiaceae bacterium]
MLLALPDRSSLPDDVEALKDLLIETVQRAQVAALDARSAIERLELQLVTLRCAVFGIRSERIVGQADLFEQKVALPLPPQNNLTITYERRHRGGGPRTRQRGYADGKGHAGGVASVMRLPSGSGSCASVE